MIYPIKRTRCQTGSAIPSLRKSTYPSVFNKAAARAFIMILAVLGLLFFSGLRMASSAGTGTGVSPAQSPYHPQSPYPPFLEGQPCADESTSGIHLPEKTRDLRVFIIGIDHPELQQAMQKTLSGFLSELNAANAENRKPEIPKWPEATAQFSTRTKEFLINTSMHVPEDRLFLDVSQRENGKYEVRDIPLVLLNDDGDSRNENAVVFLDSLGNLSEMRIALPPNPYRTLLSPSSDTIDHRRRKHILDFIEYLRMAYITKDMDAIRKVFSGSGLTMVEGRFTEEDGSSTFQKQVPDDVFSPEAYLKYLEHLFDENHSVYVSFDKLQINRHPVKTDFYGVNMVNSYTSSPASDQGYVFFLVEARDNSSPIIHARTWQHKSSTPENRVIHFGNFDVL